MAPLVTELAEAGKHVVELASWLLKRIRLVLAVVALFALVVLTERLVGFLRSSRDNPVGDLVRFADQQPLPILVACTFVSFAAFVASVYLTGRAAWNLKVRVLFGHASNLEPDTISMLAEGEVRRRLRDFSADATELSLIAGDGDFLLSDQAQMKDILVRGTRCRMVVSTDGRLGDPVLRTLIEAGVGVRVYDGGGRSELAAGRLRGRLKRN